MKRRAVLDDVLKALRDSCVRLTRELNASKKILTGLGLCVLRLSKKALAAAQSVSSPLSSAAAVSFGLISLIFVNFCVFYSLNKPRIR